MIKNRIVMLQILNKPITQKLIRLISDLPKGTFTLYLNILQFYICNVSENEKFCYKPRNNPGETILLIGLMLFRRTR